MAIYNINGTSLNDAYDIDGNSLNNAYDIDGNIVFSGQSLPIPTGDLNATSQIPLPDIYNNGHGWTCTGLSYVPSSNTFLVGDIGKELPSSVGYASKIIQVSYDFSTVIDQIDLYTLFPNMQDVQGIALDLDGTIWLCSPHENKVHHINAAGSVLGSLSVTSPTGIAIATDGSFWILTYENSNNIKHITRTGETIEQFTFSYNETLDQCFLDDQRNYLYITAGVNYSTRNNIYLFNTVTHEQSITCTVNSYSVEGLWIGINEMVILNDGYYHSAYVPVNQANIYNI